MDNEERRAKNAEKQRTWRANNRERARTKAREDAARWRATNPERSKEINAASAKRARERDPEGQRKKGSERMIAWREANPKRTRENDRKWREENPEASREKSRRWREGHPEFVAKRNSEHKKERRKNDPEWAQEQRKLTARWAKDNPEKVMEKYRQYRSIQENVLRDQLKGIERRAKKEGIPFDQRLYLRIPPPDCQSCGILFESMAPNPGGGRRINLRALSHDRLIPADGYTLENVDYLCFSCNAIKKNATADVLEKLAAYMRRHEVTRRQ